MAVAPIGLAASATSVEHLAHRRRGGELGRQPRELGGLARRVSVDPGPVERVLAQLGERAQGVARRCVEVDLVVPRDRQRRRDLAVPIVEGEARRRPPARPLGLGDELVGRVRAPVGERAEQDRLAGADHLGDRPPLVQRHLGRGDDDPRVRAHRATEPQHVPVAVDQADAGGLGVQHRRQLRLDHLVDLVDRSGRGQGLGDVGRATDHAGRPSGGLVVRSRSPEEQDEPATNRMANAATESSRAAIDLATVLDLQRPRSSADLDHATDTPGRRLLGGGEELVAVAEREAAPGRERVAHHVGQVRACVDRGDEPDVGVAPLGGGLEGSSRAVERLHEEERHGAAARGPHGRREHGAARVTRLEGRGPPHGVGQQVEPEHGPRGRGLGDDRPDGVVHGSLRRRDELAVALVEDRTADLLLERRPLLGRDHGLEGQRVDGRDGHDLAGVGAEAVQVDRAIGGDQPSSARDGGDGALRRPLDEQGGLRRRATR